MYTTLLHQYQLVIASRVTLFNYCETVKPDDLLKPLPTFDNQSMITRMMHSANCYLFWLAKCCMQENRHEFDIDEHQDISAVRQAYEQVNLMMNTYLHHFADSLAVARLFTRPDGSQLTRSPLDIFTHVITHEFHHKGQVISMSRQLGYTPVDTDVILE
jgi:uncharacterized damage-inducible protein DinB